MATLQAGDIADLVALTLKDLGKMKWTDIASTLQEHVAMRRLIKKEKVGFSSGPSLQWNMMTDHNQAAQNVGLYGIDVVNASDAAVQPTAPWRHHSTNWCWDEREISMNREPSKIVDLLKFKRSGAMISLAELTETNFWGQPADANDTLKPYGVPYWVVHSTTNGFQGLAAFGTTVAGINPTTYSRWRNMSQTYTSVTKDDAVTKMREAATKCNFVSPDEHPDYASAKGRYGYYTIYSVLASLEALAESQNDNLGNDIASKDGVVLFRKNPITWAPKLDDAIASGSNPLYGIDWEVFRPVFLKDEYLRESPVLGSPKQHRVREVHVDCTMNFICYNRRRNFVLAISDPF